MEPANETNQESKQDLTQQTVQTATLNEQSKRTEEDIKSMEENEKSEHINTEEQSDEIAEGSAEQTEELKDNHNVPLDIKELKAILADEKQILKLIKKDLAELKKNYGDVRRTQLLKSVREITEKELVKKEDVVISITDKGYIKRMPFRAYREQKRGGKGVIGADLTTGDFVKQILTCSTHDYLLLLLDLMRYNK